MYNSQTYGKMNLESIPDKLLEFYGRMKKYDTPIQIIVGTDSQNFSDTKIVNVTAVICEGHGGIYFYEIMRMDRINDVRQKLFKETEISLSVADRILSVLENDPKYAELYLRATFTIHVDAGNSERGKTKELIPAIIGWIQSQGYEAMCKPDSFVASTIADRISK